MSVHVWDLVWKVPLPTTEKIVALWYADRAHGDGSEVRPSQATTARATGLCVRSVREATRRLVERQLLVLARPAREHAPPVYRFNMEALRGAADAALVKSGGQQASSRAAGDSIRAERGAAKPLEEPSIPTTSGDQERDSSDPDIDSVVPPDWRPVDWPASESYATTLVGKLHHCGASLAEAELAAENLGPGIAAGKVKPSDRVVDEELERIRAERTRDADPYRPASPDGVWDGLVEWLGYGPETTSARAAWNAKAKEIRDALGYGPADAERYEEVRAETLRRGRRYNELHPDWTRSPGALAKYWGECGKPRVLPINDIDRPFNKEEATAFLGALESRKAR